MAGSVDRVAAAASELDLPVEIRRMDSSTRSAEDAAKALGCDVAQIVKSLIFRAEDSGDLVLLLVSGANQVDMNQAARVAGEKLTRADAAEVRSRTGFAIGGVAPIGHLEAPRIWFDRDLMRFDHVWAAAGAPNAVFSVAPAALLEATRGQTADLAAR